MRIVLINPPYSYQEPWLQITEPLGILYIAAYIERYSTHTVRVIDCLSEGGIAHKGRRYYWYGCTYETMLRLCDAAVPDCIGITCMFSRKKNDFLRCCRVLREHFPNVPLIAGGTYTSLFPQKVMHETKVDYCVIGEGERTFVDLLNVISGESAVSLDSLDGIAYRSEDAICVRDKKHFIANLDDIPFPAREHIAYRAYYARKSILHGLGFGKSASILTSRSCPNRCNFCSMFLVHGPRWRGRSAQNIFDEIALLKETYGITEFFIMDDNFTFDRQRVFDFCSLLIHADMRIAWNTPNGISINTLDYDMLSIMKKSGCRSICIAVETGDQTLRNDVIGKRLSDAKIDEIVHAAQNLRIFVTAFYIIGMPGETREAFEKTLNQLRTLPFNAVAAAFANPLPGTALYQECIDKHYTILHNDEDNSNMFYAPYIVTDEFSKEELVNREKQFYRTFIRARWGRLLWDALCMRNALLYPPFMLRILKDRLCRGAS